MRATKAFVASVLAMAATTLSAAPSGHTITGLVEAGPLCISALAARSTVMAQAGRDIAAGASADEIAEMETSVRIAHQGLASMVGEAIGAALYPLPGSKPLSAEQAAELKSLCEGLYREAIDPGPLRALVSQSVSEGLYLVHVSSRESLATKVQVLESFVLARAERAGLPAHARFEAALFRMMADDKAAEGGTKK